MKVTLAFLALLLSIKAAVATEVRPSSSLILAAIVAERSPLLSSSEKRTIAALAAGTFPPRAGRRGAIVVAADDVKCRASNVDITSRSCTLQFGRRQPVTLKGRAAHELFATLVEMGVTPSGAAGTIYIGASHLSCSLDPNEMRQKAGGGASCGFGPATD
jgi:hypothetical protein